MSKLDQYLTEPASIGGEVVHQIVKANDESKVLAICTDAEMADKIVEALNVQSTPLAAYFKRP